MGVLDDVFAGSGGIANTLIDLLGGEAVFETVTEETYNEETDRTHQEVVRQILPFVIESVSDSSNASPVPSAENGGLAGTESVYTGTVSAANLDAVPRPLKTVIRDKRARYQVIRVEPVFAGNIPVTYRLTMRRL